MANPQLRLVNDGPAPQAAARDPVRQVFEHWVLLNGKSPARCKMGPSRKAAIQFALALYDVDTVLLAVEGMASAPLDGKSDDLRAALRELDWFLAKEGRVERCAELGEAFRAEGLREQAQARRQRAQAADAPADDPAAVAAARAALAERAARMRGGRG